MHRTHGYGLRENIYGTGCYERQGCERYRGLTHHENLGARAKWHCIGWRKGRGIREGDVCIVQKSWGPSRRLFRPRHYHLGEEEILLRFPSKCARRRAATVQVPIPQRKYDNVRQPYVHGVEQKGLSCLVAYMRKERMNKIEKGCGVHDHDQRGKHERGPPYPQPITRNAQPMMVVRCRPSVDLGSHRGERQG